ncbi:MAG: TlyA family RNA methyltransferase [Actinobacteria bacterium]|jgi:23S rRNA (cytidine1920-2'-O)/16S rRNA (cytidine1409-2'-O)-methyltransferase|nr:MAG: TlyA family RNA methyltransferase [Actinomycetota bacterium]
MKRLDQWLVEEGFFPSRERARLAVMAGEVEIEGKGRTIKAGTRLGPSDRVIVKSKARFVSRGGDKLDGVLERWGMDVSGLSVLDVGSSTGGFTHCLLERGAARVTCLDVGKGQLHWDLRRDARVTVMEGRNARHLTPYELPYIPEMIVADLSFISLRLVFPALGAVLEEGGVLVALIKPQFEAERGRVGKKGVVRDPDVHREVLQVVLEAAQGYGFKLCGLAPSALRGADGNTEFFAWWTRKPYHEEIDIACEVEKAVEEAWRTR